MIVFVLLLVFVIMSMVLFAVNRPLGFKAMQVSIALVIVFAIYWIALLVLRRDRLVVDSRYNMTSNSRTLILNGHIDSFNLQRTVIDTLNPASISYASLPRSINRFGGAQFTYQFWMIMTDISPENVGYKDILIRGDVTKYNIMTADTASGSILSQKEDVLIKCPRIRFDGAYNKMAVEVNTIDDPNPDVPAISIKSDLFSLTPNKWVLYTVTFQDNVPVNDFENGVVVKFYINDLMLQSETLRLRSALQQNNGNLYLFPSGAVNGCKIGNLTYYNYAVSTSDIKAVYDQGPPPLMKVASAGAKASPLFLTEYNKLDIYMA